MLTETEVGWTGAAADGPTEEAEKRGALE